MKRLTILTAALATAASALATDVYVYPDGVYTPVLSMNDILCITFAQDGIKVTDLMGEVKDVSYDAFDYFRFYPTPDPTGITRTHGLPSVSGIYSLTGVYQGESLDDKLPAGIYLVRESVNGHETVRKILKK